jgi:flavin reductase (DIM6/NTAB) family NADH-FMN oxidoreductase RutF/DNA-binding MarR family transcriptional regulator
MADRSVDSRQFRTALGSFATGVTIVTTRAPDGSPIGLTANSFNSLSLEPPMVLWALAKTSLSRDAFGKAEYFAVNILASDQQALADLFATRGAEKFSELRCDAGLGGIPLLRGCSAVFECKTSYQYEGGDHVIFVGEVLEFAHFGRPALAYHAGNYASVVKYPTVGAGATEAQANDVDSSFSRDFLGYLLGSAHARLMDRVRGDLDRYRLSEAHYHVLMFLSHEDNLTLKELMTLTQLADHQVNYQTLADLVIRDFVSVSGGDYPSTRARLTPDGHRVALELGASLKAAEAYAERFLGATEAQTLKMLLRAILHAIPPVASSSGVDES